MVLQRLAWATAWVSCCVASAGAVKLAELEIDGRRGDWNEALRVHPPHHEELIGRNKLFATVQDDAYWFYVEPAGDYLEGAEVYVDLDNNVLTGYNVLQEGEQGPVAYGPRGYDAYISVSFDNVTMFRGCPQFAGEECRTVERELEEGVDYERFPNDAIEFRLPASWFEGYIGDFGVSMRAETNGYEEIAPWAYEHYYPVYHDLKEHLNKECAKPKGQVRAAILFDEETGPYFYAAQSYAQIFMSMQNQVRQAGIPYDRITTEELAQVDVSCKYAVVVLPYVAVVKDQATFNAMNKALFLLNQIYGVGIITNGQLNTRFYEGGPAGVGYSVRSLLGVQQDYPGGLKADTVVSVVSTEELFWDKNVGDRITDSSIIGLYTDTYRAADYTAFNVIEIADQVITVSDNVTHECGAMLATQLKDSIFGRSSGRIVHFASPEIMTNKDVVWRAVQWILRKDTPVLLSLLTTRFDKGIFTCRNDVDLSQYTKLSHVAEPFLYEKAVKPWYDNYNFVCSHYINVGNDPDNGRSTDWSEFGPLYKKFVDLENEIGSHSYTHPFNINELTEEQLKFEFGDAKEVIMEKVGLDRLGSAQPGHPDNLQTALTLQKYLNDTYFSGGYSGYRGNFAGVYGYLTNKGDMVYIAPNMQFDFSLSLDGKTPSEMEAIWEEEFNELTDFSNAAILHWPIHDYAIVEMDTTNIKVEQDTTYSFESFDNTIAYARAQGAEFATVMQLHDRIRSHTAAIFSLEMSDDVDTVIAEVSLDRPSSEAISLGQQSLKLENPDSKGKSFIKYVENHYAFNARRVLLPRDGGKFVVKYGSEAEAKKWSAGITHITSLDMRMELISVEGDGASLSFATRGRGDVVVRLSSELTDDIDFFIDGKPTNKSFGKQAQDSNEYVFNFDTFGDHVASVQGRFAPTYAPSSSPTTNEPTVAPTNLPSAQPSAGPTTQPSAGPTSQPSMIPTAQPSKEPTPLPTAQPSTEPTPLPTAQPSQEPTTVPTSSPSAPPTPFVTGYSVCKKECLTVPQFERETSIQRKNNACAYLRPSPGLQLCGCDLSEDGALNSDGSIDMEIACPVLFDSSDITPELEYLFEDDLQKIPRVASVCSQLCAATPGCVAFTINHKTPLCYLYECSGELKVQSDFSKFSSGLPCRA
mmetsp:Transcript_3796/g.6675  ORF Transcript_3796/g.6675 Transcript_3796/m.6675 type:complete len:1147 (+) Transcript_3796:272-3712(+)